MTLNRLFCIVLALCLALCLCACDKAEDNNASNDPADVVVQPSDDAADASEEATENTSEATEDTTEAAPAGITYTVTVVDEGGNPVPGAMIQVCQGEICLLPTTTDDSGVAVFSVTEEGTYEAKILAMPAGYDYATEEQVFHFDGASELTITLKAIA